MRGCRVNISSQLLLELLGLNAELIKITGAEVVNYNEYITLELLGDSSLLPEIEDKLPWADIVITKKVEIVKRGE